jgi:hypothetical protein
MEEDDAQNGVDHVDGHRSPGYIISPYAGQNGPTDHTYYTQVNMTRTIEQILGLAPMNQFDLVASPMTTAFVKWLASKLAPKKLVTRSVTSNWRDHKRRQGGGPVIWPGWWADSGAPDCRIYSAKELKGPV